MTARPNENACTGGGPGQARGASGWADRHANSSASGGPVLRLCADAETLRTEIPDRMQAARRWLLWRSEGANGSSKPRKVPYYCDGTPRRGTLDGPEDIDRLAAFADMLSALESGCWAGPGFALGPDGTECWQGIDLDHIDVRPELAALVDLLPGYLERSPSGTGVHGVGYGPAFGTLGANSSGIEAYSKGRFFTVTGDAIGGNIEDLSPFVAQTLAPRHGEPGRGQSGTPAPVVEHVTPGQVADLRSALAHLRADDRDLWIKIGHALKTLGDVGRGLWVEWSQVSEKWQPADARTWDNFMPQATDYRAVFAEAQRAGWVNPLAGGLEHHPAPMVGDDPDMPDDMLAPAGEDGVPPPPMPPGVLILPTDHYSFVASAEDIFSAIAPTRTLFTRGNAAVELTATETGPELAILRPPAFQSRIDGLGARVMAHVMVGKALGLKPKRCSRQVAEVLLDSKAARVLLPRITVLSAAPVIIERDGKGVVLVAGYHSDAGGILVVAGDSHPQIELSEAAKSITLLLQDFDFPTRSDESRALAMLITPSLKLGGFFIDPTPVDVAEADRSQAGKTYRQSVTRAIYRERGYAVTRREGGVGSLDESIASGLLSGRSFIAMDNLRGRLDSQYLEAAITLPEPVPVRVPHRGEVLIDARRVTFSMTSNGVETTQDLANRSCIVRIRKRPRNHRWHRWPEGSLLEHIEANQPYYLCCVHSLVAEWLRRGKPRTSGTGHDMRYWAGTLDWIVQNLLGAAPLMDGHADAQERVSSPGLTWLRAICIAAQRAGRLGHPLSASALWEIGEDEGVSLPRAATNLDEAGGRKRIGQVLAKLYRDADGDIVEIDGYLVTRTEVAEFDNVNQTYRQAKKYTITQGPPCPPCPPCLHKVYGDAGFPMKLCVQGGQGDSATPPAQDAAEDRV